MPGFVARYPKDSEYDVPVFNHDTVRHRDNAFNQDFFKGDPRNLMSVVPSSVTHPGFLTAYGYPAGYISWFNWHMEQNRAAFFHHGRSQNVVHDP
jgi:hypothetical protein